jgi:hypothetical protein
MASLLNTENAAKNTDNQKPSKNGVFTVSSDLDENTRRKYYDNEYIVQLVKRRRSSSVFGNIATLNEINQVAEQEADMLVRDRDSREQRAALIHGIFSKFATWELNANACFISRTKFRKFCIEAGILKAGLVIGDIGVIFYESLKKYLGKQAVKYHHNHKKTYNKVKSVIPEKKSNTRSSLLNFKQFISALGVIALKLYAPARYQHLDPRLCKRVADVNEPFDILYESILLPYAAKTGILSEGALDLILSDKEKEMVVKALPFFAIEHEACTEIFNYYSKKEMTGTTSSGFDSRRTLSFNELHSFCREYDVVPGVCSISKILIAFRQSKLNDDDDDDNGDDGLHDIEAAELSYDAFIFFLALLAIRHINVSDEFGSYVLNPSPRDLVMGFLHRLEMSEGRKTMASTLRNGRHVRFVFKSSGFK